MKITKMQGQQNSIDDLSVAQLVSSTAEFNTDDSKNMQWRPPSLASSNTHPRRHLRFYDIKTLARIMGRHNKREKEVILRLLDMEGQQNSIDDLSVAQLVSSTAEFNIDDSKTMQWRPPSLASSNTPPRRHMRFCDIKTLAMIMGRHNKREKEVILRLLDMATSEGENTKQENIEVEVIPKKDSKLAPAVGTTTLRT